VNTETVYSSRREADLVMTSTFSNPVREGLPTIHQVIGYSTVIAIAIFHESLKQISRLAMASHGKCLGTVRYTNESLGGPLPVVGG
jgi:hypothetical protein